MSTAIPTTLPHGNTARRLDWVHLPAPVRTAVEKRLGAPVVQAVSQDAGFTPGFASVLTDATGASTFVKAASVQAQRGSAASYRAEARRLRTLNGWVPAPRLRWAEEVADWVVLGIEYVDARPPRRPWTEPDLTAATTMLTCLAASATPPPCLGLSDVGEELADLAGSWQELDHLAHAEEATALADRFAELVVGDTLVHTDVRDDNLLLRADGTVLLCDWSEPMRGPNWLDSLLLLAAARGDGLEVDPTTHPLLGAAEDEAIDSALALFAGYGLERSELPAPPAMPHLREFQRWQGETCWAWLAERRGW
ncbi:MAG: phosphotransferase [Nocardioides sp.]|uniref:phosphotransferase n=1 Tax=Nocardioides sp. TaxID=35761 RepID=UPI0039E2E74C